ncbi:Hypothetical protein R9X50_00599600 [Acrodontium crateriforme]|uniref:FAD dependent oxidoreductase domain-containing protein n=1 Tax=Acrodontium crateriforme TaxID=150365 RepID=A0AAQ3RBC6_9PEZI|nr:Hypothetical protein R9X50_00599600 [Acrodontium crateriforme]
MALNSHVVVIGGGVTGLTSACLLAEAGFKLTIVAKHFPGDRSLEFTSPWGGAQWRTHAKRDEAMSGWDLETYEYWVKLMAEEERAGEKGKAGVKMYDSIVYWDEAITEDLWWTTHVQDFRMLDSNDPHIIELNQTKSEKQPGVQHAASYRAMTANVDMYLAYLLNKAVHLGCKTVRSTLPIDDGLDIALKAAEKAAGSPVDCFVNATGINAAKLCNDTAMYPIRGQTVLVKGEANAIRTRLGADYISYCVPRADSGTSILGGTKQAGNWSGEVDEQTTKEILERCAPLLPELRTAADGGFDVVSVQCGLRPGRKGGPRVEREVLADGVKVVHAYGHAGAGYQNSIGSARATVKLVQESLGAVEA